MLVEKNEDYYLVGKESGEVKGEVIGGSTIESPDQKKRKKEIIDNKSQQKFFTKSECGKFFWSLYDAGVDYFPEVSDAMLSRIIYLMTYLPYDGNYLVIRKNASVPYRPMLKDDVLV